MSDMGEKFTTGPWSEDAELTDSGVTEPQYCVKAGRKVVCQCFWGSCGEARISEDEVKEVKG